MYGGMAEAVDDNEDRQARVRSRAEGRKLRTIIANITIITVIAIIAILTSLEMVRRNIYQIDYYSTISVVRISDPISIIIISVKSLSIRTQHQRHQGLVLAS